VLTVDTTVVGNREDGLRQRFQFPLQPGNLLGDDPTQPIPAARRAFAVRIDRQTIEFVIRESGLPVIVKGINHPDDALQAIEAGAAAIQVSNHGGRQLDGAPGAFSVLPAVARAVNGRVPIIFDSGVRRGQDVFKAIASGADVVAIGRPVIYGLALGGWQGVRLVLELLNRELSMTMQLAGVHTVADIRTTTLLPAATS
jgi:L-lactate oxidase